MLDLRGRLFQLDSKLVMLDDRSMNYRDLEIWQLSRELVVAVHEMTLTKLPTFERFEEGSQIRRSIIPATAAAPPLKVVFVGHVDHGKSTLIGRILHDTNSLPDGKLEQIQKACAEEGMEFEFAFLLDALLEEQEQNITIDTTQIPFRTPRREYAIIDTPGHKEFLKNMITGASNADAAVLVIAANEGVLEQTRRHAYLLSLFGVQQFCVVVNKMDLVDFSEDRFREIEREYRKFLETLRLEPRLFIPVSARLGEN